MRLIFHPNTGLPDGIYLENAHKAQSRFKVLLQDEPGHDRRLAVVGGGPSVLSRLDEIREFDEVWGINATWRLLETHGIEASMFSIDAGDELVPHARGAKKAVLASRCSPKVFDVLDCTPTVFNAFADGPSAVLGGSASSTCAFHAAVKMGFRAVKLFGCEGSFPKGKTHADRNEEGREILVIKCDGVDYLSSPDFYTQAKELAKIIELFPSHISESGDGLLGALVRNDDHDIVGCSRGLWERMREGIKTQAGCC